VSDGVCFAGLDVHARKMAAAAIRLGSGEVWRAQLAGSPSAAIEWPMTLPGPVRAVYEAGPTGFGLARAARAAGLEVMVCSPGAIPRQPGDRIKTDVCDALKLARLHAAGQLRAVTVPSVELEALRDLDRAREDLRGGLRASSGRSPANPTDPHHNPGRGAGDGRRAPTGPAIRLEHQPTGWRARL
jgi:transposase